MDQLPPAEAMRLAEQHAFITSTLGFRIHPSIEGAFKDTNETVRIADISRGVQFPPGAGEGPSFCTCSYQRFEIQDIVSADGPVSQHTCQFDIVAVSLLHTVLTAKQWDLTFQNLISLLRPGGFLQWIDWDPITARLAAVKPGASDLALRELLQQYLGVLQIQKIGSTYKIPNTLKAKSMEEGDSDLYPIVPSVELTRNTITGAMNLLKSSPSVNAEEVTKLWTRVDDEIQNGNPLLWYDLWCHIAKKPEVARS